MAQPRKARSGLGFISSRARKAVTYVGFVSNKPEALVWGWAFKIRRPFKPNPQKAPVLLVALDLEDNWPLITNNVGVLHSLTLTKPSRSQGHCALHPALTLLMV